MGGTCSTNGEIRNPYKILVGKPDGNRSLGKHRHRYEGNVKMDVRKYIGKLWSGFIWLRIGTSSCLLWIRI